MSIPHFSKLFPHEVRSICHQPICAKPNQEFHVLRLVYGPVVDGHAPTVRRSDDPFRREIDARTRHGYLHSNGLWPVEILHAPQA